MTEALPSPESARKLLREKVFPWRPATLFAPMEGVTHPILREFVAARGGVGVVCTEFVRITRAPLGLKTLRKHVVRPSRGALSVQVMGNDIAQMAEATTLVTRAGADIVDINLGCPAPKAVRKGVGSAMLKDLKLLRAVVSSMRERTHLPLSAKIRAGFDDQSGVLSIAKTLEDCGIDFITVHPRRRVDFYEGVADWRIIRLLATELSIPVVGNGDIWTAADALRMREETGAVAAMMGRPALRNPWLFQQAEALEGNREPFVPTAADLLGYYEDLTKVLSGGFPERSVTGLLKEQLRYVGRAVLDENVFQRAVLRAGSPSEILRTMEACLRGLEAGALALGPDARGIERSGTALVREACEEPVDPAKVAVSRAGESA